jgi:hypothetical protein
MAKRPIKDQPHSWAVYQIAKRQLLLGFVHDQPDAESVIKAAIEEFPLPISIRDRLIAQRRD